MMMNPFVCGNFHHQEEDEACFASSGSSPRKSKRKHNPYSTRGLDKFSALLADLDEKRQKVYSQMSPQEISFVRFAYSNTNTHDFVPIVVKLKNKDQQKKHKITTQELKVRHLTSFSEPIPVDKSATESAVEERKQQPKLLESTHDNNNNNNNYYYNIKLNLSWNVKWNHMWRRPSFYVPAVMVLILVLLTVFGRSVATICTCVMWYIVPTLIDHDGSSKLPNKSMRKKDYVRVLSEKKMVSSEGIKKTDYARGLSENKMQVTTAEGLVSPKSGHSTTASKDKSPGKGKHGHQHHKSWST